MARNEHAMNPQVSLPVAWRNLLLVALALIITSIVLDRYFKDLPNAVGTAYAVSLAVISKSVNREPLLGRLGLSIGAIVALAAQTYTEVALGRPWIEFFQGFAFGIVCLAIFSLILPPLFKRFRSTRG